MTPPTVAFENLNLYLSLASKSRRIRVLKSMVICSCHRNTSIQKMRMSVVKPPFQRWKQYGAINPPVEQGHRVITEGSGAKTHAFFCHRASDG